MTHLALSVGPTYAGCRVLQGPTASLACDRFECYGSQDIISTTNDPCHSRCDTLKTLQCRVQDFAVRHSNGDFSESQKS